MYIIFVYVKYKIELNWIEYFLSNLHASPHDLMQIQVSVPFSSFLSFHLFSSFSRKFNKEQLINLCFIRVCAPVLGTSIHTFQFLLKAL